MKKLMLTLASVALLFGGSAHATGWNSSSKESTQDSSSCEVAAQNRVIATINEGLKDMKAGKDEPAEDFQRARYLTSIIESSCEPTEGTDDGGHDDNGNGNGGENNGNGNGDQNHGDS